MFALKVSTAGLSNDSFENKPKNLLRTFFIWDLNSSLLKNINLKIVLIKKGV